MIVKLLTDQHLEFPSLKGGCRGSFESTLVKMSKLEISFRGTFNFLCLVPILDRTASTFEP